MIRRIEQTIRERNLIRPGMHILAGVSGGADSVALLYVLWFLHKRLPFQLTAIHLHHGLRGRDADLDALLVERLCGRLGVAFRAEYEPVARTRKRPGVSLEMAAREARLDFYLRMLRERGADAVAVAHHRDDQAETILMRILTGGGIEGLAGMDYRSEPLPGCLVIRPMLDVDKETIVAFLVRHGLAWREDQTNRDPAIFRNRIRGAIIPVLEKQGIPGVKRSLIRLAELAREENRLLQSQTEKRLGHCLWRGHAGELARTRWLALPLADRRRVLRRWLVVNGLAQRELDFERVERVRNAMEHRTAGAMSLGRRVEVRWEREVIRFASRPAASPPAIPLTPLRVPGITRLEASGFLVSVSRATGYQRTPSHLGQLPVTAFIRRDNDATPGLSIRGRKPGDRIRPTGMSGSVPLKELFINHKIPAARRPRIPVLVAGDEVIWVAGYRVARSRAVPSARSPSWRIEISPV